MMPLRDMSLAILVCILAAAPVRAGQKPTNNTKVTSVVYDYDTAGQQLLTQSDHFNGSQQATYGAADWRVSSLVLTGSAWQLYLGNQSVRTIRLTMSNPVPGTTALAPLDGYYSANVEVYSQCFDQNNNQVAFSAVVTLSTRCSFGVDFSSSGTKYKWVMSPLKAGTGWATVTCNSVVNASCVNWTITPNSAAGESTYAVANLYRFAKNGSLVYVGQYYNTYRIDVTNP